MRCTRWPGQSRLVQKVSLSPSSRTSGAAQTRARGGELPRRLPAPALDQDRADHLGDDVAGLADDDRVARAHVLQPDLVLVVERGQAHRGAADEDRLEHGERRGLAGPADGDLDVAGGWWTAPRGGTCRRWPTAGRATSTRAPLEAEVVDLDHHAVDLVVEVVAVLLPPGAERQHLVEAVHQMDLGIDGEAGPSPAMPRLPTGWWPGRRPGPAAPTVGRRAGSRRPGRPRTTGPGRR